ncbi:CbtB domain-containing protein [Falsihalocynthiibacter arcticus]|uniref:CbtB domain-containing protein n=1 Tax=Falsihalocynthiibacter arcticus TaxID=1579316 RepID=UPI0005798D06|nr:CbtB domain-containing protein [Falsihalocynthiibacter arcticus]
MNEQNKTRTDAKVLAAPITQVQTGVLPIFAAALAGVLLISLAGFAQASVLHDSAHDTRHAIAFPCH